jgi:Predicted transcriptional regulator
MVARDVCERLGFSRQTLRRMVRAKRFPQPVEVSRMRYAWRIRDVEAWIDAGGLKQFR